MKILINSLDSEGNSTYTIATGFNVPDGTEVVHLLISASKDELVSKVEAVALVPKTNGQLMRIAEQEAFMSIEWKLK